MEHQHTYDSKGRQICCTEEEKIYQKAGAEELFDKKIIPTHTDHDGHDHDGHDHSATGESRWQMFLPSIISLVLLLAALYFDHFLKPDWFTAWVRIAWYVVAYLPVGLPVLKEAWRSILQGGFFRSFS